MPDVFAEILRFNVDRPSADLVALKLQRMDASAFAFFRGTDHLFARNWTQLKPADAGPPVLCSGDLHVENFGADRNTEGNSGTTSMTLTRLLWHRVVSMLCVARRVRF